MDTCIINEQFTVDEYIEQQPRQNIHKCGASNLMFQFRCPRNHWLRQSHMLKSGLVVREKKK